MFKFIVVGDSSVGKSCLLRRFETGEFAAVTAATVGLEYISKRFNIDGHAVQLQVWDTAGQESLFSIVSSYFRSACGVLLVFDVTRRATFAHLERWFAQVEELAHPTARLLLLGNKGDLAAQREVAAAEAEALARQRGCAYLETSAKDGRNVREAFLRMAQDVFVGLRQGSLRASEDGLGGIKRGELPSSWDREAVEQTPSARLVPGPAAKRRSCCE